MSRYPADLRECTREEDRGFSSPCWIWLRQVNPCGYGQAWRNGAKRKAHRVFYTEFVGPIPEGLDIDHLCRVKLCVNPAHLEPVTRSENVKRQLAAGSGAPAMKRNATHCIHGHPRTPENTYYRCGRKWCLPCRNAAQLRRYPTGQAA